MRHQHHLMLLKQEHDVDMELGLYLPTRYIDSDDDSLVWWREQVTISLFAGKEVQFYSCTVLGGHCNLPAFLPEASRC